MTDNRSLVTVHPRRLVRQNTCVNPGALTPKTSVAERWRRADVADFGSPPDIAQVQWVARRESTALGSTHRLDQLFIAIFDVFLQCMQ